MLAFISTFAVTIFHLLTFPSLDSTFADVNYRLDMIAKLPNAHDYNTFAYHTPLLKEFVSADSGGVGKRRSSKNGADHTNPRVVRRGTYVSDKLVHRSGSLRDLTSRSDGDEPKGKQGSFRKLLNGSGTGPRARRAQNSQSVK